LEVVQLWGERREEQVGERLAVVGVRIGEQRADMGAPESVGAGGEAPCAGLDGERQVDVAFEQFDHGRVEGGESLGGRRPGA
jgi:hypothetical protein